MRVRSSRGLFYVALSISCALLPAIEAAAVDPVVSELQRSFPSLSLQSSATFEMSDAFVGSGLITGLRPRSAHGEAMLRILYPRTYDGLMVAEVGSQRVVLRAIGAANAAATESEGKLVYAQPYAGTDVVTLPGDAKSGQLLTLRDRRAAHVYEYEIVTTEGVAAVVLDSGAVRFVPKFTQTPGTGVVPIVPSLQIDKPWTVDASGRRTDSQARWTLIGEGAIPARIRLTVTPESLRFPIVVDASFSTTGSMTTLRRYHSATLLTNGKILMAGGVNGPSTYLASAELFDPVSRTFSATGSMITARGVHTGTLLPDGKVLIAGGRNAAGNIAAAAELYDPATGTFTATGSLNTFRNLHTATLLLNGKVLIAGGGSGGSVYFDSAELYDPSTGLFTATSGNLTTARSSHTATLLPNGKVLIAAGTNATILASAELYDPASNNFSATNGPLAEGRVAATATLLATGKVLIAGGANATGQVVAAQLFDPALGTFGPTGSLGTGRSQHSATLLPNGKVLIAGGSNGAALSSVELYDPAGAGSFSATASLATARYIHAATLLPDGIVLIAGGRNTTTYFSSAELFDASNNAFGTSGNLVTGRAGSAGTLLPNGKVLIAGGYSGAPGSIVLLSSAELYDAGTGIFTATGSLLASRQSLTATLLPNGKVLITGGATAELFNPATNSFAATGSPLTGRSYETATLLPNGKVLVAGGWNGSFVSSAELYDPATGSFSATGSLNRGRRFHKATLLPNGKVLIAGGYTPAVGNSPDPYSELYDPATGTFSPTGPLHYGRSEPTATLLPNGKVLFVGGSGPSGPGGYPILNSAELYDPTSGTFSDTGSMSYVRQDPSAALLPNGKVLVAGGVGQIVPIGGSALDLAVCELYDPVAGTFTMTSSMAHARRDFIATFLPTGKMLIAAGFNGSYPLAAELFDAGTGFADSRRPVVTLAPSSVSLPGTLTFTGSGFQGDSEGSGGTTNGSSANYPLLQLRRVDNDQTFFVAGSSFTSTTWSGSLSSEMPGWYRASLITNGVPSTQQIILLGSPDLTVSKTHSGNFSQGQTGAVYTITVSNSGTAPTSATVTAVDVLPGGLSATEIAGSGWNCTLGTLTCTRSDALGPSSSFPAIAMTVTVAANAATSLTNQVSVSGGGEVNTANDTATDPTTITAMPDLTVVKSHTGNFIRGQSGATYTITVTNGGGAATSGDVTLVDEVPSELAATAAGGGGWNCVVANPNVTCTRSDVLAAASSYPAVTLTVDVSPTAGSLVTNTASVSGGGELATSNNTGTDPTTIDGVADLTVTKTHSGNFTQGQTGATYTITVSNAGDGGTTAMVTVTDALPQALTATAMSGSGWDCTLVTRVCTRSDALAAASSYPAITLTVDVAIGAPSAVTNSVTAAGGGQINTTNDSATDIATVNAAVLAAPANLITTATSINVVSGSWVAVGGAVSYQVFRASGGSPFALVATPTGPAFDDSGLTPGTAYVYRVAAVGASANVGPLSNNELAITIAFTDDPLVAGSTIARAVHLTELRTAVNAVRAAAGLTTATFTDPTVTAGVTSIKAVHFTELRTALDGARSLLSLPAIAYTSPPPVAGVTMISAADITDLRNGVK